VSSVDFVAEQTGRFRRIIAAAAVAKGLGCILIFSTVFIVGFILLDWAVRFPVWIRVLFSLILCTGGIWCFIRDVYLPLCRFRNPLNIARHLEKRFPLHDAYASAVFFRKLPLVERPKYTHAMLNRLEAGTADLIGSIRSIRAIDLNRTARIFVSGLVCVLVFGMVFFSTSAFKLGTARILFPIQDYTWPEETGIWVVQENPVHPRGEVFPIEAHISGREPEECVLITQNRDTGESERFRMSRYSSVYRCRLKNPMSPFSYRVKAGRAESNTFSVTLVDRPEIETLRIRTEFPEYTGRDPERKKTDQYYIRVLQGSVLHIAAEFSKPVESVTVADHTGQMIADASLQGNRAEWSMRAEESIRFTVLCRDRYGFGQNDPPQYTLWVETDPKPEVSLVLPERNLHLIRGAEIPVRIAATDNFGIREIGYAYSVKTVSRRRIADFSRTSVTEAAGNGTFIVQPLVFNEGDRIIFWGQASDFNRDASSPGQSEKIIIEVVSNDALLALFQREKVAVKHTAEKLLEEQERFIKKLKDADDANSFALESDQNRIASGLQNVERDLERLLQDYQYNKKDESRDVKEVEKAKRLLHSGTTAALRAVHKLRDVSSAGTGSVIQDAEEVRKYLRTSLEVMKEWEIIEHIIRLLRTLISDQETIAGETLSGAGTIPRKEVGGLTTKQREEVNRLGDREASLKRALERIEFKTEDAIKVTGRAARREQLKRAVSFIHDSLLYKKMDSAVFNLKQNRIFAAYGLQRTVLKLLTELARIIAGEKSLKDRFRDIEGFLAAMKNVVTKAEGLLSEQERIRSQADQGEDRGKLAKEQKELARKIKDLLEHMKKTETLLSKRNPDVLAKKKEAESILSEAGKAAFSFSEFISGLNSRGGDEGKKAQDKLKEFIDKIKKLRTRAQQEKTGLRRKDFTDTLKAVLELQKKIGGQLADLSGRKELGPEGNELLRSVRKDEQLNREAVEGILKVMSGKKEHVFRWMLRNILSDMNDIITGLNSDPPDRKILFLNEQVIMNLQLVIKSLVLTVRNKAGGPSSSGGGGGGGDSGIIPPLFELKLIREVQNGLNRETRKYLEKGGEREEKVRTLLQNRQKKLLKLVEDIAKGLK